MPILYGEAKKILSRYAGVGGKCATSQEADIFTRQVLEYLLVSGDYGNLRKFCFHAVKGYFTAPYELEIPLKIKIDGNIGSVWDKWFEWHDTKYLDACVPAADALYEEPNYYFTAYDIPDGGSRIGAIATCEEDPEAHLIVQGSFQGKEVFSYHKGEQIKGEYLSLVKSQIKYTNAPFDTITGITKSKTKGYVQLLWVNTALNTKGFLSDYSPFEEKPSYRRFKLTSPLCGLIAKVSILGRIRLKAAYADNDYIPFDSMYTLQLAGQSMNSNFNDDPANAKAKDDMMTNVILKTNEYKRVENGQPIEVFQPLSPGNIKNIVSW